MKRATIKTIFEEQLPKYHQADVRTKSMVLDHVVAVTGIDRKSAIRAFGRLKKHPGGKSPPRLGRPVQYTAETEVALAFIWEQYDYPCAERLHPDVTEAIRIFKRDGMWRYGDRATGQLLGMSLGSMKSRCTALAKTRGLLRGQSTTRSGELLRSVPVFFGSWKDKVAGHGQIDTVVHSGSKLMGTMAYTVNYVDVATYWQEPVAQLNKGERATIQSIQAIQKRLPIPLLGLHPDSGSEFINQVALRWVQANGIDLSRSRPNKKNDNCYIEQRNLVVVRKYVGYERYDCQEAVDAMNELYCVLRLYVNYFQPTFKLQSKTKRVKACDGKQFDKPYKRVYDTPRSPYQRMLERDDVSKDVKAKLRLEYETLNPKVLRDRIKALTMRLERVQREQGYHY